jgi:Right handed beta helix region
MTRINVPLAVLTATLALALPAQAQNGSLTRSFVSSSGVDSNPCTITQPCATFAHAYTAVGANGIIAALDPGKYGPLTITTGVTINGNGWSAITAPASGTGIIITAGTANVTLIGLEIDGAQAGYNGIVVNSAGSLTVTNCTLQNFVYSGNGIGTGNGILMQPSSGSLDFTITGTNASNNGYVGVFYYPSSGSLANAVGVIDNVTANANLSGISIDLAAASNGTTVVTVSNSTTSDNTNTGIIADGGSGPTVKVSIDQVSASGNGDGVTANGAVSMVLGRSVITGNTNIGVADNTTPGSTLYTYGDNRINLNAQNLGGTQSLSSFSQQ